jgi:hypothetical protein
MDRPGRRLGNICYGNIQTKKNRKVKRRLHGYWCNLLRTKAKGSSDGLHDFLNEIEKLLFVLVELSVQRIKLVHQVIVFLEVFRF